MSKAYRPSNGFEGDLFMSDWCAKCQRDRAHREDDMADGCSIITSTMAYAIDAPEYPVEWQQDDAGRPSCTAFDAVDAGIQPLDAAAVVRPLL